MPKNYKKFLNTPSCGTEMRKWKPFATKLSIPVKI